MIPVMERASCLIMRDNKILLVKEGDTWKLPGGDVQDDPEATAVKATAEVLHTTPSIVQLFNRFERQIDGENFEEVIFEATLSEEVSADSIDWCDVSDLKGKKVGREVEFVLDEL
ncbi:MAG: NUDIX domain-containing protein, partial [Candidatus Bathyarchaeota archaeon]|nr:NUDIX domain-containing protein [Candidatus Bathyarchaeota archaeon]